MNIEDMKNQIGEIQERCYTLECENHVLTERVDALEIMAMAKEDMANNA